MDQATMFTGHEFNSYLKEFEIQKIHSTHYFAQANGQAEATNKVISKMIAKMVDGNPKNWHVLLHYATWAYRTSKIDAIGTILY
uniref:Integrase catalytic domain-containing protein n=2 Tax=Chenopodium quinoa TaxID=63459 RepID=A0A803MZK4_CHEQI